LIAPIGCTLVWDYDPPQFGHSVADVSPSACVRFMKPQVGHN
jgi:hypothetical protein